jgi:hypothetical protein
VKLEHKLCKLSHEKADLLLKTAEMSSILRDQEDHLSLHLSSRKWEEQAAFHDFKSAKKVLDIISGEERRAKEVRMILRSCISPIEKQCATRAERLNTKKRDVNQAIRLLQKQHFTASQAQRVCEQRKGELAMLKEEFNRQRSKVDAIKQRVRESSALMSQQSKRAKTDLVALQMEIAELKETEKDMDEWYGTVRSLTHLKILFFLSQKR